MVPLVFMMGEYRAEFPSDRTYAKNHMWAMQRSPNRFRFGFSSYAVRLLQDVYFIDFSIEEGANLTLRQEFGTIESKKAESGLYAPMEGKVAAINPVVTKDPSAINVDRYGVGWLLEIEGTGAGLLDVQDYLDHLESAWEVAQRTIKGQANA